MNVLLISSLLRADGSIIVNKQLAKEIGINEAIIYSELLSKYMYFYNKNQLTEDGYFFNTVENLERDTTLSKYQQQQAIKKLKDLNLITTKLKGVPSTRHFKILDNNVLESLLLQQKSKNYPTRSQKTSQLEVKKLATNNTKDNNTNNNNNKDFVDNGVICLADIEKEQAIKEEKTDKIILTKEYRELIKDKYNEIDGLRKCKFIDVGTTRFKAIQARLKETDIETLLEVLETVKASDFLTGKTKNSTWKIPNIEWIFNKNKFNNILEGMYSNEQQYKTNDGKNETNKTSSEPTKFGTTI